MAEEKKIEEIRKKTKSNLKDHLCQPFTKEQARKGAQRSAEVKRQKRSIAETTRIALEQPVTDARMLDLIAKSGIPIIDNPTYRDLIVAQTVMGVVKRGKPDELLKMMEITGEYTQKQQVEVSGVDNININITGEDADKS